MLSAYEEPVVVTECSVIIVDVTSWCVVGRDLKIPGSHHSQQHKAEEGRLQQYGGEQT